MTRRDGWLTARLRRAGVRVDVGRGAARMAAFRNGWAAGSDGVAFHRAGKTQFRYRERAAAVPGAPTLVFAADPPATVEFYDEVMEVFSQRFRVVVLELPAMGFSATTSDFGFGFTETNDDVARFLADIAGEGAVLAFSCVATLCAIDLAARRPELVSALVLIQGGSVAAFDRWKAARDPNGVLARPVLGQVLMRRMAPKRLRQWYELSAGRRDRVEGFCDCAAETMGHGAMWSLASAYQVYMDPDVELAEPAQPTLVVWGEADRSHPDGNARLCAEAIPHARSVVLPGLGHAPEVEDPAAVFRVVTEFLDAR